MGSSKISLGYARVSTEEQEQHGKSLPAQVRAIEEYCTRYDLKLRRVICEGASGKSVAGRRKFSRLLRLAAGGRLDAIVVTHTDRFSRDFEDAVLTRAHLRSWGVALHMVELRYDDTPEGRAMDRMTMAFAHLERERIGQRTRNALQSMKAQAGGRAINGRAPYGWRWENGEGMIENPTEQVVVATIQTLRGQGISVAGIAATLNQGPARTTRHGGPWHREQVRRILVRNH